MIIRELVTRLGFDADDTSLRKFEDGLGSLRRTMQAVVVVSGALSAAIFEITRRTAQYGDEVAKTSRTLGFNARELQAYRFAFDRVGIGQEQLNNGLERLLRNLGQAADGNETARKGFDALGVEIFDTTGKVRRMAEVFPEVIDGLNRIEGEANQARVASELFGRSGIALGRAVRQGSGELEQLITRYDQLHGGITEAGAALSEDFMDALTDARTVVTGLRYAIGVELMPVVKDLIASFTDWVVANRELIQMRVSRVLEVITRTITVLWRMLRATIGAVNSIVESMGGWETVLHGLAIAIGALALGRLLSILVRLPAFFTAVKAAVLLLSRVIMATPIGWLVTGLALLLDDMYHWSQGSKSILGDLLGDWGNFIRRVEPYWAIFKSLATEALAATWRLVTDLAGAMAHLGGVIRNVIMAVVALLTGDFQGAFDRLRAAFDALGAAVFGLFDLILGRLQPLTDGVTNAFSRMYYRIRNIMTDVKEFIAQTVRDVRDSLADMIPDWAKSAAGLPSRAVSGALDFGRGASSAIGGLFGRSSEPEVARGMAASAGRGATTIQQRVDANISLQVPLGTPQEQRRALELQTEEAARRIFRREMAFAATQFPETEG